MQNKIDIIIIIAAWDKAYEGSAEHMRGALSICGER